ncbi:unnamed protein product, partial [Vitis vinifera]
MDGKDPAKVIREALAKALIYYYPFAGRLVEGSNRKLLVDCTGEGVLFVEADADTTLEYLGDAIQPPCPCFEELLYDVPGSGGILGCPLLLFQVTRLRCGGFVLALRLNHTMSDSFGLLQFLNAVSEIAQGAEEVHDTKGTLGVMDDDNTVHRSFFFGPKEIRSLKMRIPQALGPCTTYEALAACVWRCRTVAFGVDPNEFVRFSSAMSMRGKRGLQLPSGYYGNAFAYPAAIAKVGELCKNPLGYAVELVKKVKAEMSEEYIKSLAALMVIKGRPLYTRTGFFIISDNTRVDFQDVDFGWGKPLYGGLAKASSLISFFLRFRNSKGEEGIVVPIQLPLPVMERFEQEVKRMVAEEAVEDLPTVINHIQILQQASIGNSIIVEKTLFLALVQNISNEKRP